MGLDASFNGRRQEADSVIMHGVDINQEVIQAYCRKWKIRELSLFGSVLRDDFRADSDVDFLFDLEEDVRLTIDSWIQMEEELQGLVGRRVDLVPRRDVERSENYIRRKHILSTAESVYVHR